MPWRPMDLSRPCEKAAIVSNTSMQAMIGIALTTMPMTFGSFVNSSGISYRKESRSAVLKKDRITPNTTASTKRFSECSTL